MMKFKTFLVEEALTQLGTTLDLDRAFIRKALPKIKTLQLTVADFKSLDKKAEIQFLFSAFYFKKKFDWKKLTIKTLSSKNVEEVNKLIKELKASSNFNAIYNYTFQGIGPGEVMLYYLINNATLKGTGGSGDLRIGNKKIEAKAAGINWTKNTARLFGLGSKALADADKKRIENRLDRLLKKNRMGKYEGNDNISPSIITKLREKDPRGMKSLDKDYAKVVVKNYFSKHDMLFFDNEPKSSRRGEIAFVGKIKQQNIEIHQKSSFHNGIIPIVSW